MSEPTAEIASGDLVIREYRNGMRDAIRLIRKGLAQQLTIEVAIKCVEESIGD